MPDTKLITGDKREFVLGKSAITVGRIPDNFISFPEDSNVSRFHVQIDPRDGEYWIFDLGSSNGTTINDAPLEAEMLLKDGDVILLGGTSKLEFVIEKEKAAEDKDGGVEAGGPKAGTEGEIAKDTDKASKIPGTLIAMGVICGLAAILVVAAILYSVTSTTRCDATARIKSPDTGDVVSQKTDIQVEVKNGECVGRVIYVLEDKEIASADKEPFKGSLEPGSFSSYASDGQDHGLKIVLEDKQGNRVPQPGEVRLVFETLATPTPTPVKTPDQGPTPKKGQPGGKVQIKDLVPMVNNVINQFPKVTEYKMNQDFLLEVQKKTAEYVSEGYYERAKGQNNAISDAINVAFVKGMNVDGQFAYYLAMSRSKFNPQPQNGEEGFWRMSNDFATANSLNGMCGTEKLGDPAQNCAANVTALYVGKYLYPTFDRDFLYAVAAFGMTPGEAAVWRSQLPADRSDFWSIITKSPKQREEVVRFFAAAVVAENPQKFGLKKDQPISDLYSVTR